MKKPLVFSLVHDQSVFMTAIMSLLTFLAVLALGVALSVGTGVIRWNAQWSHMATIQVMDEKSAPAVKKILSDNGDKFDTITQISTDQMKDLMRPWISGGGALEKYLPQMWEVKFKSTTDMQAIGDQISKSARFLTHADAMHASTSAGWQMIFIATLVLAMILGAIGICISYIARNTAMLHRRELEILNQVGATDTFVARQMQIIVTKICVVAGAIGLGAGAIMLLLIMAASHAARVGLMAMMGLNGWGWLTLCAMPTLIIIFAIWITRRTTLQILKNN